MYSSYSSNNQQQNSSQPAASAAQNNSSSQAPQQPQTYNYQYGVAPQQQPAAAATTATTTATAYGQYGQYGQYNTAAGAAAPQQPTVQQQNFAYQYGVQPQQQAYGQYNQPAVQAYGQYNQPAAAAAQQPTTAYNAQYGIQQQQPAAAVAQQYGAYPGAYNAQYNTAQPQPPNAQYNAAPAYGNPPGYAPVPQVPKQPDKHSVFQDRKRKRSPSMYGGAHPTGPTGVHMVPQRQVRVSSLPERLSANEMELRKIFSSCGKVMCMNVPHYHDSGKPRNYAFIKFSTPDEASRACRELNGKTFYGNTIRVLIADKQAEYSGRTNTIQVENLRYDDKAELIRKEFSKHGEIINFKLVQHHNSGRATAIIEYRYGHSVQRALNEFHDDVYVGEAVETGKDPSVKRRKLEYAPRDGDDAFGGSRGQAPGRGSARNGDSREPASQFDDSIRELFVTRLPAQLNSNKDELRRIFEPYGPIEDIDIIYDHQSGQPKGTAYIMYQSSSAARQACQALNRSTYYGCSIVVQASKRQQKTRSNLKVPQGETPNKREIYIANLPTNLTQMDVANDLCAPFKTDIDAITLNSSPPRAFVRFHSEDFAARALGALNESTFRGRTIIARYSLSSDQKNTDIVPPNDPAFSREVHVGNVPYEYCNDSSISKVFSVCGQIVDIRLPARLKETVMPRGYAFVTFSDADGALRAVSLHGIIMGNRAINVSYPKVSRDGRAPNRRGGSDRRSSSDSRKGSSDRRGNRKNRSVSELRPVKKESKGRNYRRDEGERSYNEPPAQLDVKTEEENTNFEKSDDPRDKPFKASDIAEPSAIKVKHEHEGPMEGRAMQMGSEKL